jgi:hypothetical protein
MRRFAWWPIKLSSGRRVWLSYYWLYKSPYDLSTGRPPLFNQYFEFTETEQERTFRLLKESVAHNRNVWNNPTLTQQDRYARNLV